MITCSVCGETKRPSAFYKQGDTLTGKKRKCKRCHQGHMRVRMKGVRVKTPPRAVKSPELLTLHEQEKRLDAAWTRAIRAGKQEQADKIRAKYNKIDIQIAKMIREGG